MTSIKDRIKAFKKLEWRKLKPFQPENLKTMTAESFQILKNSILSADFLTMFYVWEDNGEYWILDGHHRKFALESLEKDGHEIPDAFSCGIVDCSSREEANQILLSYSSSHAKLDEQGLSEFIHVNNLDWDELKSTLDLPDIDLEKLSMENVDTPLDDDEDEIPEAIIEATTKLGDIWILGNHRLMCGDSIMFDNVERLMNGQQADFVYTDPPYGINLETDYKKRYGNKKSSTASKFYGEDHGIDLRAIVSNSYCVKAKEVFIWGADNYPDCLPRGGSWIVWDKSVSAIDGVASDFELCWSRERHHYSMIRKLWKGAKAREETGQEGDHKTRWGHPTQKPIELATTFFEKWGKKAVNIVDFFGGSGTTLIACEKTNRICFMMEISPQYCDLIIKRWQKYSGLKAIHAENNMLFDELSPLV